MEFALDQVNNNSRFGGYPEADSIPGIGYVDSINVNGGRMSSELVNGKNFG